MDRVVPSDAPFALKPAPWLMEAAELKDKVLRRFAEMPEALQHELPSQDSWSAAGMVEHLILVEECIAGLWRERLAREHSVRLNARSQILTMIVSAVMGQTSIRVPTMPELVPTGDLTLPELERRWQKARKALAAALPDDPDAAWVLHPALGPLSASQMGTILAAHLRHHLRRWPTATRSQKGE